MNKKEPTISKKAAEEFSKALDQIGTGWYRYVLLAEDLKVPEALGYLTLGEWIQKKLGGWKKYTVNDRRKIALELTQEGKSQRQIAAVLGVGQKTISRDLGSESNDSKKSVLTSKSESNDSQKPSTPAKNEGNPSASPKHEPWPSPKKWKLEKSIQRAANEGMEELVWEKVKDRFIPFWLELLESLEPDEHEHLIWAVHNNIDKIDYEKT